MSAHVFQVLVVAALALPACSSDSDNPAAPGYADGGGGSAGSGGTTEAGSGGTAAGGGAGTPSKAEIWAEGLGDGIQQGIAEDYPQDVDIAENEWVYAAEDFESGSVQLVTQDDRLRDDVEVVSNVAHTGKHSAKMQWPQGEHGRTTRYELPTALDDNPTGAYFVRVCYRYDASFHPGGDASDGVGVKGFGVVANPDHHNNTVPCDGTNWYNAQVQFVGWGPSQKPEANDGYLWVGHAYSYNPEPESAVAAVGDPELRRSEYRFSAYADPYDYIQYDTWRCYEIGMYLNTPGKNDGEMRFWIDGVLQSRTMNMRYRDVAELVPTDMHINLYRTTTDFPQTMVRHMDNIVLSRRYVGPVAE
ncbi:MAG: hypothetical protein ACOC1F_00580 [Myxococcota bacterium]